MEEKKNKQTRTWVSSKRKKGEVCDTFVKLSVHLQTIASVYSSEIPTKPLERSLIFSRWPTRHLSPQVPVPTLVCRLLCSLPWSFLLTALFSALVSSLDCPLLCHGLFCRLVCSVHFSVLPCDIPSLVLFWSPGKSRAQVLCAGFAPKLTKESSDWYSHTPAQRITSGHTF